MRLADHRAAAHHQVEHAGRQPGAADDLGERPGAARHEVGGLEHDAVAVGERRRDLPGRDRDREVPRRDEPDDADRLAGDLDLDAGPHRGQLLAGEPQRLAGEELEDLPGARRLADAFGQGLALLARRAAARARPCGRGSRCRSGRARRSAPAGVAARPGREGRLAPRRSRVSAWRASARAYSPTTSSRFDGLRSRLTATPSIHSPAMRF